MLKISARNAGQVELAKYCPRCVWYLLRFKRMPYQIPMPGIMFYMEATQKAFIKAFLAGHDKSPKYFGPFADCVEPIEFPFRMEARHEEADVLVTAQVDMMLRKSNGQLCLLDLKTALADGGGKVFAPQYAIQVIGYSWVAEQNLLGKVGTAGLLYCEIQKDAFVADPLNYKTDSGFVVPFNFTPHEVKLEYARFTKCLKEANRVWKCPRPPRGVDNCKDCQLLAALVEFDNDVRQQDQLLVRIFPERLTDVLTDNYWRAAAAASGRAILTTDQEQIPDADTWDAEGMWANWDFS